MRYRASMARTDRLFSHAQAIEILRVAPDRLRNFVRVPVYSDALGPAQQVGGKGKGTRLMYGWYELCKLSMADALLTVGWQPTEIARAIAALQPSDFRLPHDYESESEDSPNAAVLVRYHGRWTVRRAGAVADVNWSTEVVYIHCLLPVAIDVAKQIERLEADGTMPSRKPKFRNAKGTK